MDREQLEMILLPMLQRIERMEQEIESLKRPQLMYRPPSLTEYQTISETLDYLHNSIEDLRKE
jgi:hypothetical protein